MITSLERADEALWYSHFRPPIAQRRQAGFASSHFTRRALQVVHPVRTLDALSRVFLGAAVMINAAKKASFVARVDRNEKAKDL